MDWQRAIEINREALTRIVAALVSLLAAQGGAARLPLPVYQLIAKALYPAESALRRLLVFAARGLIVDVPPAQPMPPGLVIGRNESKANARITFKLYDTRKTFNDVDDETTPSSAYAFSGPRIRTVGDPDPRSQFLALFPKPKEPDTCSEVETLRLQNRLMAVKRALDQLPRQAKRMARWLKRRAMMKAPKFIFPMRPGAPPGHRKRSKDEINLVLRECHALAWHSLNSDTS